MKKVLIITYYWIPSGGAGVQRWVKFTKYLRDYGWEPIIYTPENPEFPSIDESFAKDIPSGVKILKQPIWEPYNIYKNITGKKGEAINAGFISEKKKQSKKDKFFIWLRGNFFIPDPRVFWVKPSIKYLTKYIKSNPVDAIITTGPPHSMHLIGLGLKKAMPKLAWVADFRDPWTKIDFYKELNLSYLANKKHHRLEANVIKTADSVIVVSEGMKKDFEHLTAKNLEVITNGYDESDTEMEDIVLDEKFTLAHIGTLNAARNPNVIWKALSSICSDNEEFSKDLQIKLIGKIDFSALEAISKNGLNKNLLKIDYLAHTEAIKAQKSAQVLMLLINNTENASAILTGKFFEYLAANRPIIAVGPTDGDVAKVLSETNAGNMVDFYDEKEAKATILSYYERYKTKTLNVKTESVERFSRRSLTGELVKLLNSL